MKSTTQGFKNALSRWNKGSFNELGKDEKNAVKTLNTSQLACFARLMEEKDSHCMSVFRIDGYIFRINSNAKMFVWQLGYHPNPLELRMESFKEVWNDFVAPVPVPVVLGARVTIGISIMQASVQADIWFALEAVQFPFTFVETPNEVPEQDLENGEKCSVRKNGLSCVVYSMQLRKEKDQTYMPLAK